MSRHKIFYINWKIYSSFQLLLEPLSRYTPRWCEGVSAGRYEQWMCADLDPPSFNMGLQQVIPHQWQVVPPSISIQAEVVEPDVNGLFHLSLKPPQFHCQYPGLLTVDTVLRDARAIRMKH